MWAAFVLHFFVQKKCSKFPAVFDMHAGVLDWAGTDEADLQSILDEEDNVKTRIIFAREELKVRSLSWFS